MNFGSKCLLFAALAGFAAEANPITYTLQDLGALGGAASANGVNASGQTAATVTNVYGDPGAYASGNNITPPGASGSMAAGINIFGQVTGTTYLHGTPYATLWTGNSPSYIAAGSYGLAVNDSGQVTGMTALGHAFVSTAGVVSDLGVLAGGDWTSGYAINGWSQVAGYGDTASGAFRAFVWTPGLGYRQLGTLGGASSYAFGINDSGLVVGSAQTGSGFMHAFSSSSSGLTDLGTLGGGSSYAYGVNGVGSVVGYSYTSSGESHAFFSSGGRLYDLNALMAEASGWTMTAAYGINDAGQIAGSGWFDGTEHAILLTPVPIPMVAPGVFGVAAVPEPSTIYLLVGGLLIGVSSKGRVRADRKS